MYPGGYGHAHALRGSLPLRSSVAGTTTRCHNPGCSVHERVQRLRPLRPTQSAQRVHDTLAPVIQLVLCQGALAGLKQHARE